MIDKIYMAIAILGYLADGKVLTIKDGYVIGMAENGFVGFVIEGKVNTFSEVTFSQLVRICKEEDIVIIPSS